MEGSSKEYKTIISHRENNVPTDGLANRTNATMDYVKAMWKRHENNQYNHKIIRMYWRK